MSHIRSVRPVRLSGPRCLLREWADSDAESLTVGLHRVEATTRPDHAASWRVLEKVGMRREGLSRDHLFVRGRWWDSVRYAMLATDR